MPESSVTSPLDRFSESLERSDLIGWLRDGLIGEGALIPGPFGPKALIYADYVASGRALRQVEQFVMTEVLPHYANSHTEASFCGAQMTRLRNAARRVISQCTGASSDHSVIFCGSGATAGLNRLVYLFGVPELVARGQRVVVFIGPYEHHSNILPWRASGAEVIEISEGPEGGPDLDELAHALDASSGAALRVGAFSAASNVTGIKTDVVALTRMLRNANVRSVLDYAGGGPYLPIDMGCGADAVVISPHKFLGGPSASGLLIVRRDAVFRDTPVFPGGGTVQFVSPVGQIYAPDLCSREESGTPNVIGDIRAALVFLIKDAIGQEWMDARHASLDERARSVWMHNPKIELLGMGRGARLPIFAFRVRHARHGYIHHQLFTRMLSDCHGIQARGGCACAGPYAHRLLKISCAQSAAISHDIQAGNEMEKPGWVRLNFSALLENAKADQIIEAVDSLAREPDAAMECYCADPATARFMPLSKAKVHTTGSQAMY